MYKLVNLLAVLAVTAAWPAMAQSFSTDTAGYQGSDAVRLTFDSPLPSGFSLNGGRITTGNVSGRQAQPKGSTGNYLTTDIGKATITADRGYGAVSFLWGSIDTYNSVSFFDQAGKVLGSLTGSDVASPPPANGDQTSDRTNRYVTFTADAKTGQMINSLQLNSTGFAFETDNFAFINAKGPVPVPEPGVAVLFGSCAALVMLRRRRGMRQSPAVA